MDEEWTTSSLKEGRPICCGMSLKQLIEPCNISTGIKDWDKPLWSLWISFEVFQTMPDLKWLWFKKTINQYNTYMGKSSTSNLLQLWFWQELQLLPGTWFAKCDKNSQWHAPVDCGFFSQILKDSTSCTKFTEVFPTEINTQFFQDMPCMLHQDWMHFA